MDDRRTTPARRLTRRTFLESAGMAGAALALAPRAAAAAPARWSDPRTWGGKLPGRRSVARIDRSILMDADPVVAGVEVTRRGRLTFERSRTRTLTSTGNVVIRGTLVMRPASHLLDHISCLNRAITRYRDQSIGS